MKGREREKERERERGVSAVLHKGWQQGGRGVRERRKSCGCSGRGSGEEAKKRRGEKTKKEREEEGEKSGTEESREKKRERERGREREREEEREKKKREKREEERRREKKRDPPVNVTLSPPSPSLPPLSPPFALPAPLRPKGGEAKAQLRQRPRQPLLRLLPALAHERRVQPLPRRRRRRLCHRSRSLRSAVGAPGSLAVALKRRSPARREGK